MAKKIKSCLRKGNFRVIDTFFDPKELFVPENDGGDYKLLLVY